MSVPWLHDTAVLVACTALCCFPCDRGDGHAFSAVCIRVARCATPSRRSPDHFLLCRLLCVSVLQCGAVTMLRSIKNRLKGHSAAPAPAPATPSRPDATRTPKADTHLPRRQRRCVWARGVHALPYLTATLLCSRSSIIREEKVAALRDLPMLKDTSLSKREVRIALSLVALWHCSADSSPGFHRFCSNRSWLCAALSSTSITLPPTSGSYPRSWMMQ